MLGRGLEVVDLGGIFTGMACSGFLPDMLGRLRLAYPNCGLDRGLRRLMAARLASASEPADTGRAERSSPELARDESRDRCALTSVRVGDRGNGLSSPRSRKLPCVGDRALNIPCRRKDDLGERSLNLRPEVGPCISVPSDTLDLRVVMTEDVRLAWASPQSSSESKLSKASCACVDCGDSLF